MSDGMRIALIGVVGALLGTLVGGGVTYVVTQSQISSQRAEARRSERLDAYSTYLGDTEKFWNYTFTITKEGLTPKAVTATQRADLNNYGGTLIGDVARIGLLAPPHVALVAQQLYQANTAAWNALAGGAISYGDYDRAVNEALGTKKQRGLIPQFSEAIRADLGTP